MEDITENFILPKHNLPFHGFEYPVTKYHLAFIKLDFKAEIVILKVVLGIT